MKGCRTITAEGTLKETKPREARRILPVSTNFIEWVGLERNDAVEPFCRRRSSSTYVGLACGAAKQSGKSETAGLIQQRGGKSLAKP